MSGVGDPLQVIPGIGPSLARDLMSAQGLLDAEMDALLRRFTEHR